tara:strand:+ start:854 stop:5572 length:4719 start_codon:yes stop_codon:yes gene_type:complete
MSQRKGSEAIVYIGPASLCPMPEASRPYILITGDQDDWTLPLILKRTKRKTSEDNFSIKQNAIGKPGTTKTWHSFDNPNLNGIANLTTIQWINPTCDIEEIGSKQVENRKLQDILTEAGLAQDKFHLIIAQGDPDLTLKRSKKILKNCLSIDLSLHPFGLIWHKSANNYLKQLGFSPDSDRKLFWKTKRNIKTEPLAQPSESDVFIGPSLQTLIHAFDAENCRSEGHTGSDLTLLKKFIQGEIQYNPKNSMRAALKLRFEHELSKLADILRGEQRLHKKSSEGKRAPASDSEIETQANSFGQREGDKTKSKLLRGNIDGFKNGLSLTGWADSTDFGTDPSKITVIWREEDKVIGEGTANVERKDLSAVGIQEINCGFSIEIDLLKHFSFEQILDSPIALEVVEQKSQQSLSKKPWQLTIECRQEIVGTTLASSVTRTERRDEITSYLKTSKNSKFLLAIRKKILEFSAMQCMTGSWQELSVLDVIHLYTENLALNYGRDQESASRLELVLVAWIKLIICVDKDKIHDQTIIKSTIDRGIKVPSLNELSSGIRECLYVGLQKWEKELFDENIRPLYDVLIATLFLQKKIYGLNEPEQELLDGLATLFQDTLNAPNLAFQIRSILKAQEEKIFNESYTKLAHQRGDRFLYLLSYYSKNMGREEVNSNLLYYAAAIDFATYCPAIHREIKEKLKILINEYLAEHPRQSKPRHWVERLGQMSSNTAQMLVAKMNKLGFPRKSIVRLHQELITVKEDLANLIWIGSSSGEASSSPLKKQTDQFKWLIVGEKSLSQCWMYRVEQKKYFLESLGCQVRCVDQEELQSWSFTHDVLWADAVILCRLPAMYPYFRAIAFAKQCGKKTYAEIDDLIFTPDYPAEFNTYGGSIPLEQYKNLCVDYPLRLGILNAVDEVIVSTQVLADACRSVLDEKAKPIHVVPNLPLPELETAAASINHPRSRNEEKNVVKIALTSGTLSHKQILKDLIYPVLIEAFENHPNVELTIIGHIELPSTFSKYAKRITSVPFTTYSNYLELLKQTSIALVPLEVHPTTHAKSAIKWMEASLCGVASICSPVKAYTDVAEHGKDVLIAGNLEEWRQNLNDLIKNSKLRRSISKEAYKSASNQFNSKVGEMIWSELIRSQDKLKPAKPRHKILVINVFFAPQSVGGATRVAQDYVQNMLKDPNIEYDVTVLCTDYERWQSDIGIKRKNTTKGKSDSKSIEKSNRINSMFGTNAEELIQLKSSLGIGENHYRDSMTIDYSNWTGAKVVRLNMSSKPWSISEDKAIEDFCIEFFKNEKFDSIQCHCCQILTASPLVAARKLGIPYEIIMHDAWWMSEEQFLVSPAGRLIDPSDPLDHFDEDPSEDEKYSALARRTFLFEVLEKAERRIAVSGAFKKICESAGIKNVDVKENTFTSMERATNKEHQIRDKNQPIKICHIGGMSMHKGYQLFRQAVKFMPKGLDFEFTIVDHRLAAQSDEYKANWNGYSVSFIAPIAMDQMQTFYSTQDVLVAPSIWPESFGLVTREAISAGLWVIASDSGALAEPLRSSTSRQGTIIRPNHLDDLIKALRECGQYLQQNI